MGTVLSLGAPAATTAGSGRALGDLAVDEHPPASGRTRVKADVEYVDSAQNRGAGSVQGIKLRRYCSGQRFVFVWY